MGSVSTWMGDRLGIPSVVGSLLFPFCFFCTFLSVNKRIPLRTFLDLEVLS